MFQVIHKLTNKPVRNTVTLEVLLFLTVEAANAFCAMKNKVMGADFYAVEEVK